MVNREALWQGKWVFAMSYAGPVSVHGSSCGACGVESDSDSGQASSNGYIYILTIQEQVMRYGTKRQLPPDPFSSCATSVLLIRHRSHPAPVPALVLPAPLDTRHLSPRQVHKLHEHLVQHVQVEQHDLVRIATWRDVLTSKEVAVAQCDGCLSALQDRMDGAARAVAVDACLCRGRSVRCVRVVVCRRCGVFFFVGADDNRAGAIVLRGVKVGRDRRWRTSEECPARSPHLEKARRIDHRVVRRELHQQRDLDSALADREPSRDLSRGALVRLGISHLDDQRRPNARLQAHDGDGRVRDQVAPVWRAPRDLRDAEGALARGGVERGAAEAGEGFLQERGHAVVVWRWRRAQDDAVVACVVVELGVVELRGLGVSRQEGVEGRARDLRDFEMRRV